MGFLDNITGGIKREIEYNAGRGVTDAFRKGVDKLKGGNTAGKNKCPKCGKPVLENAKVCGQCGTKLMLTCTQGHINPYGTKFCTECGEAFK